MWNNDRIITSVLKYTVVLQETKELGKSFIIFLGISTLSPKNTHLNFFQVFDYSLLWFMFGILMLIFFSVYAVVFSKEYVFTLYLWINSSLNGLLLYEIGCIHLIL